MQRRALSTLLAATAAVVSGLAIAGCGDTVGYSEGGGDRLRGKELFVEGCGSCHTLADAGTKGAIGPNLDYAFLQSRIDGLGESSILQVVRGQIAYPVEDPSTGAPGMPADIFTGEDADDVASYVASVAGLDANGDPIDTANPPEPAPAPGAGDGKAVFASAGCGGCHTLAAAGTNGNVGPDLDDAKPDKALVIDRVTNGQGGMPSFKDQLSEAQIEAVADFVTGGANP